VLLILAPTAFPTLLLFFVLFQFNNFVFEAAENGDATLLGILLKDERADVNAAEPRVRFGFRILPALTRLFIFSLSGRRGFIQCH
jgi:hypothetical protein